MPARCFVAIDLPSGTQALLARAGEAFLADAPSWTGEKWVRPRLMHVTVRFAGPVPDPAVPELLEALAAELAGARAFGMRLEAVHAVPAARRASMLWAGIGGDVNAGRELQASVERVLARRFGVEPERRAYTPHVTLVRARSPRQAPDDALAAASDVLQGAGKEADGFLSVRLITLYASTLGEGGPHYERLGEVPLVGM